MDVIITKYIGIYGTGILAQSKRDKLVETLPEWLVDEAAQFCAPFVKKIPEQAEELSRQMTEIPEQAEEDERQDAILMDEIGISWSNGAVYAKEYTEFGVLEALFSMSKELKVGLEINIEDIPIKQETVEICEALDVNPYALFSGGSAVIVTEDGMTLVSLLEEQDIPACIVGCTVAGNDKVIVNGDERGFLPHIRKDELKNVLGRREYYERTECFTRTDFGNC